MSAERSNPQSSILNPQSGGGNNQLGETTASNSAHPTLLPVTPDTTSGDGLPLHRGRVLPRLGS
jgi:hypothetical protein